MLEYIVDRHKKGQKMNATEYGMIEGFEWNADYGDHDEGRDAALLWKRLGYLVILKKTGEWTWSLFIRPVENTEV